MAKEPSPDNSVQVSLLHELIRVKTERLVHDRESRRLTAEEEALKYAISKAFRANTLEVPPDVNFNLEVKEVPFVEDWPAFITWIIQNDAPDVLQKRITESAVWARLEAGIDLPGVVLVKKDVITALPKV